MKVAVAVHGRFHGFDLAGQLHRRGYLARLLTTYPGFVARRFLPAGTPLRTAPWLEAVRRAWSRFNLPHRPDLFIAESFGRFAAGQLPDCDLLVAWSGAALEILQEARRRGIATVLERGSTHMDQQCRVLAEAHARWGSAWNATDPGLVERERREYELADRIALGSTHAAAGFRAEGVAEERLVVNPYGVDLSRFSPPALERDGRKARPRILFVGSVGVRKGVPELLHSFAPLAGSAELHLVGPVEPGFASLLRRLPSDGVTLRGPLPGSAVAAEYGLADLFILPSIEEGFGMVILQAMACGLPVVATSATGLPDADPEGQAGIVVPPADVAALRQAMEVLVADGERRLAMGRAASAITRQGWSWDEYGVRAVAAYRTLLQGQRSGTRPSG